MQAQRAASRRRAEFIRPAPAALRPWPGEGSGEIRSFFAIELGSDARRAAAAVARRLRDDPGGDGVRWVQPEALHVTLRFLGEIDPTRAAPLARRASLELAALLPFALRLAPVELFPSPRRPRVVALRLEPSAPLVELAAAVERACVAEGFPREARPYRAHLTLGRVGGARPRSGRAASRRRAESLSAGSSPADSPQGGRFPGVAALAVPAQEFAVEEVVLFRSELSPAGSRYTPIERVPLGAEQAHHPI